jgi:hypothetical protein
MSMLQAAPGEVASLCSFTGANALARMRSTSHILVQHVSSPAEHAHISCEGMMGTCTAPFAGNQNRTFLLQEIKIEVLRKHRVLSLASPNSTIVRNSDKSV